MWVLGAELGSDARLWQTMGTLNCPAFGHNTSDVRGVLVSIFMSCLFWGLSFMCICDDQGACPRVKSVILGNSVSPFSKCLETSPRT